VRLQDAANLGRKRELAALLPDRIDSALLDTYDTERQLAAERVMMHSHTQFALMRPAPKSWL